MKYFYEFKEKNGFKCFGYNLYKIKLTEKYIQLFGVDIIPTTYDFEKQHWSICLYIEKLEYLKIKPMFETKDE